MKKLRKILVVLLAVSMALLNAVSVLAEAAPEGEPLGTDYTAEYEFYNPEFKQFFTSTQVCQVLTSGNHDWKGWLVATSNVVINKRVTVNEHVHLILGNNCTVTCTEGIEVETATLQDDAHLTIYAQPVDPQKGQKVGELFAIGSEDRAGIGSGYCVNPFDGDICGEITIHGGYINATGGEDGAGIGGGEGANGAKVTIYGGEIKASGGECAAGIGGGLERADNAGGEGGSLTVYGGVVTATGGKYGAGIGGGKDGDDGSVTILGGTVTANGTYGGAGIGGGDEGDGGTVEIRGGTVTAKGNEGGAGIGGGYNKGKGGVVRIYDGTVTAKGDEGGAGIGGGYNKGKGGTVRIYNGTVTATGDEGGAGIGGGRNGKAGSVEIFDGTVTANGGKCGAGIGGGDDGDGGDVTVWGGTVNIYAFYGGAAIGGGYRADGGNVTLNGGSFNLKGSIDAHAIGRGEYGGGAGTLSIGQGLYVYEKSGKRINAGFDSKPWRDCEYFLQGDARLEFSVRRGDPVPYIGYDPLFGEDQYYNSNYTFVTKNTSQWKNGCYVVEEGGTLEVPVTVSGDVYLIIEDGQTLTASKGIRVEKGASLTVFAQSTGANRGKLIANGENNCAGIGGGNGRSGGAVTIHGCDVTANGGQNAAGIGGGQNGSGGLFTIYGGKVSATAGSNEIRAIGAGKGGADHGRIMVRDCCDLHDEVTGKNIERSLTAATDWASKVNEAKHILTLVPSTSYLTDPVPYLYYDNDLELQSAECRKYNLIKEDSYTLNDGWYVVKDSITFDHPLSALGDAHLILTDGTTLSVKGGVCVNKGYSLTIHAQTEDNNKMGRLIADASDLRGAGIGANSDQTGSITIDGGRITAKGGEFSAGIGGSYFSGSGNVKIHGGIVNAESTSAGAGIGSGRYDAAFDLVYDYDDMEYDFEFYDYGENGSIEITGGAVNARGEGLGAGIGGGEGYNAGSIAISGGNVTAEGGEDGVGIGSGYVGDWDDEGRWRTAVVPGGAVNVKGGEVTAIGGGGTSLWEDERGAFMAKTLNIASGLSVIVYKGNTPTLVEDPAKYVSACRDNNKVVIMGGAEPVVPKTGDKSNPMLWTVFMAASLMGFTACIVCGKRKRNEEE